MGKKRATNLKKMIRYLVTVIMLISFTMTTITVNVSAEIGHNHQQDVTDQHDHSTAELGVDHSNHGHELIEHELLDFSFQEYADHNISNKQYRGAVLGLRQFGNAFIHEKVEQQDPQVSGLALSGKIADVEASSNDRLITGNWNPGYSKIYHMSSKGRDGSAIKIAIFDSGIDLNNEYIRVSGGVSFVDGINSYDDDNGHGTAMAGILTSNMQKNSSSGTAPEIELYSVKVLNKDGVGNYSNVIKGIEWAIEHEINIITLSLGGYEYSKVLWDAIDKAIANNILVIAAAGNDGADNIMYPAAYPEVISVGALNADMQIADFSNYGEGIDILAPGEGIYTVGLNDEYIQLDGTSCSVQYVAGLAALIWSNNINYSIMEAKDLLYGSLEEGFKIYNYDRLNTDQYNITLLERNSKEPFTTMNFNEKTTIDYNYDIIAQACTHSWVTTSSYTAPTCAKAGSQGYKCKLCGATKTEPIPKTTNHTWVKTSSYTAPTCAATGSQGYKCSVCSTTKTESIAKTTNHTWVKTSSYTAPTCAKEGSQGYKCSVCSGTKTEPVAKSTTHTWVKTSSYTASTCIKNGSQGWKCSVCSTTKTEVLGLADHIIEVVPSTSHSEMYGHKLYDICKVCNANLGYEVSGIDAIYIVPSGTHTTGKGDYYRELCTYCNTLVGSGYSGLKYEKSSTHTTGLGHYWKQSCSCGVIEGQGYINDRYMSGDLTQAGHGAYGHAVTYKCYECNTVVGSENLQGGYSNTGSHTSSGHSITTYCYYCDKFLGQSYQQLSYCLSCTTPPSISFNNLNASTVLKETDTAFQLQIKVQDNENDTLTCNYYLDGSTTSSGTVTATGTSSQKIVAFQNTINIANLSEGNHTIKATVRDSIAPMGEATVTFKVDKSAPSFDTVSVDATKNMSKLTVVNAKDLYSGLATDAYCFTLGNDTTDWLSSNYYTFYDLKANQSYSYSVEVKDKVGHIKKSTGTFSTSTDRPIISATALSENRVQLIIKDTNSAATNYKVQVGSEYATASGDLSSTEAWFTLTNDEVAEGKVLIITGLAGNTMYGINVWAKDRVTGNLESSNSIYTKTSPNAPLNISCIDKGSNYIRLKWNGVDGGTNYEINRETLSEDGTVLSAKLFNETTLLFCEDSDVLANQSYRYKIRAKNSWGLYSSWSEAITIKTLPLPPEKVSGVSVNAEGKILNITWDTVTNAIGYKVRIVYDGKSIEKSTITNKIIFDSGTYNCQCDITIQAFNVTTGSDINDSTKWSNGGTESDKIIYYSGANTPIIKEIQQDRVTPNAVTITLDANENPESVKYIVNVISNDILIRKIDYIPGPGDILECTISMLAPETNYSFKVRAVNSIGHETEWSNEVYAKTLIDYPKIPYSLRATAKADKIALSWENAENAQSYKIERNGTVIDENIISNYYVDEGLDSETEYTYRIMAQNTTGYSDWSQSLTKKTLGILLPAPIITVTEDSISTKIEWSSLEGASGYDLEIDGDIYNVGLSTSYIHNGLVPGSLHNYRIRTRNIFGKGSWSEVVSVQTIPTVPDVPGNIKINTTDRLIRINWSSVMGATSYDVEIDGILQTDITALEYIYTVPGDGIAGTEHLVRVSARNAAGQGGWSEVYVAVLASEGEGNLPTDPLPTSPTLTGHPIGSSIIQLEWNEIEGATSYQLEVDGIIQYSGTMTTYLHVGLQENSQHQYRVSAGNFSGYSEWSNPFIVSLDLDISTAPADITYYRESDTLTKITWNSKGTVGGYRLEVNGQILQDIFNEKIAMINTVAGEQYNIRIASIINNGESEELDWSDEITFRVSKKLPSVPDIREIKADFDSVTFNIGQASNALGYELEVNGQILNINNCSTYKIEGLEPSTTYRVKIRAYNEGGRSEWSEEVSVTTDEGIPGVPTNIIGKSVADSNSTEGVALLISWEAPEGAESFEIEDEDGTIFTSNINQIIIKNLVAGKQYTYRVRALTQAGVGAWSSRIIVTPQVTVPTNVVVNDQDGIIHISWDKVGGVGYYEIELDGITVATTEGTNYEFDYKTFFKNRKIRVRACIDTQKSEWSQNVSFEKALPVAEELLKDEEISVLLPVVNADINHSKLTITYNTDELILIDAFEMTPGEETASVYLSEYNTHIIIEKDGNLCTITFLIQTDENTIWSGVASSIKFKSLVTGAVTLYYEVSKR